MLLCGLLGLILYVRERKKEREREMREREREREVVSLMIGAKV
jgi:hypothetical protein